MNTVETSCPYCKKANTVEKSSSVDRYGLQKIRCSHCSKSWEGNLSETEGLTKSAPVPSSELAKLRVQVRGQLDELLKQLNALQERRTAAAKSAKFNTSGVEKIDVVNQELNKALANGKPVTFQPSESSSPRFQTVESVGSGRRVRSGWEIGMLVHKVCQPRYALWLAERLIRSPSPKASSSPFVRLRAS